MSRKKSLTKKLFGTKRAKQRFLKYSIVAGNLVIIGGVAAFVLITDQSGIKRATLSAPVVAEQAASSPLDTLSSSDVAVHVARTVGLTEATAVTNQSDSIKINAAIAQADSAVVAKPQIMGETQRTAADVQTYITVPGDTISGVATKFGVTSDSIRWSNGLSGEALRVGTELTIPPVNGIVYTVKSGDTAESIASKYRVNQSQLVAFNDAELAGFAVGQRIVIPGGQQPVVARYSYGGGASGGTFAARYGYNGYDYGWCTYYVAARVSVPTNWGNANTWDNRARLTPGWTVSSRPVAGAVGQTDRGSMGHVVYIEAVSEDGTMIKYSDMNGIAGWNRVGHSDWVPASKFPNYIYR